MMISPLIGASIDIYAPSLPSIIVRVSNTSQSAVQLTIAICLIGYAIGQILI